VSQFPHQPPKRSPRMVTRMKPRLLPVLTTTDAVEQFMCAMGGQPYSPRQRPLLLPFCQTPYPFLLLHANNIWKKGFPSSRSSARRTCESMTCFAPCET
jgi:hypothetical protein